MFVYINIKMIGISHDAKLKPAFNQLVQIDIFRFRLLYSVTCSMKALEEFIPVGS
jgi:hypothetical protein